MYYVIMFYIPVPVDVLNIKLKISHVLQVFEPVCYKWELIGVLLEVEEQTLDSLQISHDDDHTKLYHVIQKWIEMDGEFTPVTLNTIFNVFINIKTICNSIQYLSGTL